MLIDLKKIKLLLNKYNIGSVFQVPIKSTRNQIWINTIFLGMAPGFKGQRTFRYWFDFNRILLKLIKFKLFKDWIWLAEK